MSDELCEAVRKVVPGARADLEALIRIPSVSADPGAAGEVRRCAERGWPRLQRALVPRPASAVVTRQVQPS